MSAVFGTVVGGRAVSDGRAVDVGGTRVTVVGGRAVSDGRAVDVGGTRVAVGGRGVSVGGISVAAGSIAPQPMIKNGTSMARVIALLRADIFPSLSSCQLK
jgi:hypothetical protein